MTEGITVDSFPFLETFDPTAVFYVIVNEQDFKITGAQLLGLLARNLSLDQLPNGIVTTQQLAQAIVDKVTTGQLNEALSDKVTTAQLTEALSVIPAPREKLTSSKTYYVRKDGSNTNNGLTNDANGAFLTIQHAIDVASKIDFNENYNFLVTIQVGPGIYEESLALKPLTGTRCFEDQFLKAINIFGNIINPSTVSLKINSYYGITATGVGCDYQIRGFTLDASTAPHYAAAVYVRNFASILMGNIRIISNSNVFCFYLWDKAKVLYYWSDFELIGSARCLSFVTEYSIFEFNTDAFILTENPHWNEGCFLANFGSIVHFSTESITGTSTGKKFILRGGSGFDSYGSDVSLLPGSIAGTTDSSSYVY